MPRIPERSNALNGSNTPITAAPSVTVVVATRDRLELLRRAVTAILDQEYDGSIHVVVVFDQSEPVDIGVPTRPGRTVTTTVNANTPGLAGSRNTGVSMADTELVAFCDDDDEWLPGKLRAQTELLATSGGVAAGTGIEIRCRGTASPRHGPERPVTFRDLLKDRIFALNGSTLIIKRDVLIERVGPVDEQLPGSYAEDYDLLLRIAKLGPIHCVREPLVAINWQGSFFSRRFPMIADALTHLLDKHPEFATEPHGLARIEGQIAFYQAAAGNYRSARRWGYRAVRHNWRERRAYLAFLVAGRVTTGQRVLSALNARGRGI
ncbi:Glycosyltransferase like family 2 [Sinosporangium album]|uniref:Glycosyltransferase like family 2 n=1 Tax=Sinosporangium album TaxID=504805 RepID=A0A1G7UDT2_9ACTN|nr:glycosyltransferase family A protein [Sinosporangium album]SDG45451.1 Glycosyltransferase like family 2 [Sinosporangium album]